MQISELVFLIVNVRGGLYGGLASYLVCNSAFCPAFPGQTPDPSQTRIKAVTEDALNIASPGSRFPSTVWC